MKHLLAVFAFLVFSINIVLAQQNQQYITKTIKGKEYIIYSVISGDTWENIAQKFNITERSLIDANQQTGGSLKGIKNIKVPAYGVKSLEQPKIIEKEAPVEENTLPKFGDNFKNAEPKQVNTTDSIKKSNKPTIYGQELRTEFKGSNSLIVYKVGEGDNIKDLATYYNCSAAELIERNNITSEKLITGKIIKIPLRSEPNITEAVVVPVKETIAEENTLAKSSENIKNDEIKAINVVDSTNKTIIPAAYGEELNIDINGSKSYIVYKIGEGDNINSLAAYYYCTAAELIERNKITTEKLKPGKIIRIPSRSEPVKTEQVVVPVKETITEEIKTENNQNNYEETKVDIKTDLKPNETLVGDFVIVKKLGSLYIKHLVISGEDLTRISKINYTTNSKIISANNLKTSKVNTGQILLVPTNKKIIKTLTGLDYDQIEKEKNSVTASNLNDENKSDTVASNINAFENVKGVTKVEQQTTTNDSLIRYNWGDKIITTTSLLDSNAKKTIEDMVRNMNLNEVHANSNPGETKESYTHLVLPGEKIETIAKKYKISINDIANWNNLYQNRIRVGQDLIVNAARARKPYLALNSIDNKTIGAIKKTDKSSQVKNTVEKGLCLFKDDKFIGIAHKSLPIGTLVLITSTENFKKIYARITSILENSNEGVIIQVDKTLAKQLAFNSELTNVIINYALVE
ncbi:MAG: LysM peptidoglycan-binding domain-containing protein [Bacteroidota bacterium]|jgi:LysM repeat protein